MLVTHYTAVRKSTVYKHALIVVAYEGNSSFWSADDVREKLERHTHLQPMYFLTRYRKGGGGNSYTSNLTNSGAGSGSGATMLPDQENEMTGIWTGRKEKQDGIELLKNEMRRRQLCFAKDFVSGDPEEMQRRLIEQLTFFRFEVEGVKNALFGQARWVATGKDKSGIMRDDSVMCVLLGAVWWKRLMADDDFVDFCVSRGFTLNC